MQQEQNAIATQLTIGPVRFSYLKVQTPHAVQAGQTPKYSTAVLIPKTDEKSVAAVKKIIAAIMAQEMVKYGGKLPNGYKKPLKDGDAKDAEGNYINDDENYRGMFFFNASAIQKPGIVDKKQQPLLDMSQVYSGMWGYVNVNFYPYDNVSKGIGVGLNHIMKTKDDTAFTSRISVDTAFAGLNLEEGLGDDDLLG